MRDPDSSLPWLVLVHQLPAQPSRARVKTWRRLQGVGAVAVKKSVYLLPNTPECREDFEWIRAEIVAQGGEAIVFAARVVDDLSAAAVADAYDAARESDWQELAERGAEVLAKHRSQAPSAEVRRDLERRLRTLRARAERLDRIDPTGVRGRQWATEMLGELERLLAPEGEGRPAGAPLRRAADYRGRVWLTRPRPGIDRMASAWLIRRFLDPRATFRFAERIPPGEEVVPFDMYGVELGHRGERVTFETFLGDFGLADPALERIARLVHDVDLRAEAASQPEAATVAALVEGLRASFEDDALLLDHGIALFEALYASLRSGS